MCRWISWGTAAARRGATRSVPFPGSTRELRLLNEIYSVLRLYKSFLLLSGYKSDRINWLPESSNPLLKSDA